ncbi:murein biosynthesis integral membrane protein MurJ [Peptoclostridium sp.]|uniref:murein biosynthesis integral membrane protein MurJ n=1 Tax=Peptoclostridium sp. TaxID=1904860 RepID=UPI0026014E5A|nr:murein biosynthesis integral membrane protein MurJ [Peptoclostridium sp.]
MKRTAVLLMVLTILTKFLGFIRDIILSYFYGASNISDIYLISITIPMVIFSFIGTGIATGYIPMYSNIEQKYGLNEVNQYTNNIVNILLVLCTVVVILGLLFTEQIVKVFASGFEGETLGLAIQFTKITIIGIYFSGVISIFSGYLQIKGNYFIPAIISLPMNMCIILAIFISSSTNIIVLAIGSVLASVSQVLLILPFMHQKGYKYKFVLNTKDKHVKKMLYIALPVIMGVSINQINTLVDKTIASQIAIGGISALNYALKLNGFIQGIFVVSVSTAMYPMISKMSAENNIMGLKKSISEAISSINLLILPTSVGAMIFAEPIVNLLYGRGAFDSYAVSMTSSALFFYSMGMIGYGLREVLAKGFYSLQDTKTPMINAAISMLINIVLNVILSKVMGINGLALATSISAIVCTILLFISFGIKIGSFGMKQISISFLKILFASLVMGLFAKLSFNYLTTNIFSQNISLIISIAIGAAIYFINIYFMKIEDVDVIVNALKRKIARKAEAA